MANATVSSNSDVDHVVPPWWCLYHFSPIELEIIFTIALYARHIGRVIPYLTSAKKASLARTSHIPLVVHILLSLTEVIRFYTLLFISDRSPLPMVGLDLLLCVVNSVTALMLARVTPRGIDSKALRVNFQVLALMRLAATGAAVYFVMRAQHYVGGSDDSIAAAETARWLHRASIKMMNTFAYDRWLADILVWMRLYNFWTSFSIAFLLGGVLAVQEGNYPGGTLGYYAWMGGLMVFEDWVGKVARTRASDPGLPLRFLLWVGLVDIEFLKPSKGKGEDEGQLEEPAALEKPKSS